MNILEEKKRKPVTTTYNVWVEGAPIMYVYTDDQENWYFSEKETPIILADDLIDDDESFLCTVGQILKLDPTLKNYPTWNPTQKFTVRIMAGSLCVIKGLIRNLSRKGLYLSFHYIRIANFQFAIPGESRIKRPNYTEV